MNFAYLHLLVNHFPVITITLSLAFFLWGYFRRSDASKKIGLILVILAAISALPAYFSGDPAMDRIENQPGYSKDVIHEHEEAGEFALIIILVAAACAGASFYFGRSNRRLTTQLTLLTFVLAILSSAAMARAAHSGGIIKHDEIRGGLFSQ